MSFTYFPFNATATTEIYTLSLHDALPISALRSIDELLKTAPEGQLLRRGIRAAIIGKPNVGKSSLLNRLLGHDRAIVSTIPRSEEHTSELQSQSNLVCRLLLEKKKKNNKK